MGISATELADEFAVLHRAAAASGRRARACLGAALQAMLLFLVARYLRRIERQLRALPPIPAATARPHAARTPRLWNAHGRPFIARQDRPEVLPTWWAFHPGARAHVIRAAPIPRPHTPRAPPHARTPT